VGIAKILRWSELTVEIFAVVALNVDTDVVLVDPFTVKVYAVPYKRKTMWVQDTLRELPDDHPIVHSRQTRHALM